MDVHVNDYLNSIDFETLHKFKDDVVNISEQRAISIINDIMGYPMLGKKRSVVDGKPVYPYKFKLSKDNSTLDISWKVSREQECSVLITPFECYVYEVEEQKKAQLKEAFKLVQMESQYYLDALKAKFAILMNDSAENKIKWSKAFQKKLEEYEQYSSGLIM